MRPQGDLISRSELKLTIKAQQVIDREINPNIATISYHNLNNIIDNAPTVKGEILTEEAYSDLCLRASEERPQGEWIREEKTFEDLSGAFETYTRSTCSACNQANGWGEVPYCPWCGTKMERKHDGHGETDQKQEG